jgi:hypothetical protein
MEGDTYRKETVGVTLSGEDKKGESQGRRRQRFTKGEKSTVEELAGKETKEVRQDWWKGRRGEREREKERR